jgi:acetylornithine deacetylase
MRRLFELTRELVNIESLTGNESTCADFLANFLRSRGFPVELQPVSDGRANVCAAWGEPEVVLGTHMDTVPPFFPASEDAESIYGRGACDAKGSLACQLVAAERLLDQGVRNFGLLFLVGEETLSDGARAANLAAAETKFLVIGEPTNNKLVTASKGTLHLRIRVQGRMAHSAYPQLGESAIDTLLDLLGELRAMPLPEDPELGPTTLNIGLISGGRASNVISDLAEAQVLYRTVNDLPALSEAVAAVLQGRCEYEFVRRTPTTRMERLDGFETDVAAFTTDLAYLGRWGKPLLLGPGSITEAHTDHEHVRKADLVRAVELYERIVRALQNSLHRPAGEPTQ